MFAVIRTGGKQYRVAAEDVIKVEKVKGDPGEIVQFGEVLVVGGDDVTLGVPSWTESPPTTSTSPNWTISPGSPLTLSTWITSSAATRYCLPPVLMTANIVFPVFNTGLAATGFLAVGLGGVATVVAVAKRAENRARDAYGDGGRGCQVKRVVHNHSLCYDACRRG